MKKTRSFISLVVCVIMIGAAFSAFAAVDASKQIKTYDIDVYLDESNDIVVDFYVSANDTMDEIGAESIKIYRKVGTHWVFEDEATRDDAGMTQMDKSLHSNTIYYPAEDGLEYKVVVKIFAENADGYDSRSKTFYL